MKHFAIKPPKRNSGLVLGSNTYKLKAGESILSVTEDDAYALTSEGSELAYLLDPAPSQETLDAIAKLEKAAPVEPASPPKKTGRSTGGADAPQVVVGEG